MAFDHHEKAGRVDPGDPSNVSDVDLRGLQSDEGWLYASSPRGRFHALFGPVPSVE
jgi:hypothetical protein